MNEVLNPQRIRQPRVEVNVDVEVSGVLSSSKGTITDLTEGGAKINCEPHAIGSKIKIDAMGGALWAKVRWAEADRMGVQFETEMPSELKTFLKQRTAANDCGKTPAGVRPAANRANAGFGRRKAL